MSTTKVSGVDMNGLELVLDADADTTITADTDDQIDIKISGADDFQFTANTFTVLSGSTLTVASGATIANSGTATGFGGSDPSSADGDTLGTASAEWSDLYLADGGVIYFGNDQEVTLTHNADTSLTCNLMVAATTFEPTGDTAAGDNAAIGYTSAEGLILTGQGSTNDVTIKNDADADVIKIPTGTTGVTMPGALTSDSINFGGSTLDKYISGSWTPIIAGATTAGTQTYSDQAGEYIQIGRLVIAAFTCVLSDHDDATNGIVALKGHPKTVQNYTNANHECYVGYQSGWTMPTNEDKMLLSAGASDQDFDIVSSGSGGVGVMRQETLSDSSRLSGVLWYMTAA